MTSRSVNRHPDRPQAGTQRQLDIVIVGGSLGGLFAALALKSHPQRHRITILERNATPLLNDQGAGIAAGGDTLAFFKRYDRCGRQLSVLSKRRQYLNKEGEIIYTKDLVRSMTSWDLLYFMLRANVDGVESGYCDVPEQSAEDGLVKHLHGHKVTGVKEEGSKVQVSYQTGKGVDRREGTVEADLVIGADGPSSTIRCVFEPTLQRMYTGYVALRGTIREDEVTPAVRDTFSERSTFFHAKGIQILAYLIPGEKGTLEPGKRLINFVYYTNIPSKSLDEPSPELAELLTDVDGVRHRITMPPGKMDPKAWEKQCVIAKEKLPPQFAEIVCATKKPFVQAITDVASNDNEFLGGKVVLIGDAIAGLRPHATASTSQAAFDAMILADMIEGKIERDEWKKQTLDYARIVQKRGVEMGNRSQFGDLPVEEMIEDRAVASSAASQEQKLHI
ncbi:hypothetical protein DHEL01_v212974 [Diaporthe helianthi]|uniref:Uncharacterized protein n=1 Tax=Diaporthe helianthi TaxID=158607 RepID=A0A2P5HEF9_DIAHE|nr:hypothetical protein DHEL01_v212974 [Diaporthe helianthi]